jgi:hypothetical protein
VSGTTDDGLTTCNPVDFTATVPHDQGNHTGSSTTASKKLSAKAKARALRLRRSR